MTTENSHLPVLPPSSFLNADAMLQHWQGHRSLTRRVIAAFPEEALFSYSIGGMRPFAEMAMEIIRLAVPGVKGVATGHWDTAAAFMAAGPIPDSQKALLHCWDEVTAEINKAWATIPAERFGQSEAAFGQYEGPMYATILYLVDNEIHHRGQGYVYLRSLGINPPGFWVRE